jgi:hypothetical protein
MIDHETEATLIRFLSNVSATDDPATADHVVELYLGRFGDDRAARLCAVRRLTQAMLAEMDHAERRHVDAGEPDMALRRPK